MPVSKAKGAKRIEESTTGVGISKNISANKIQRKKANPENEASLTSTSIQDQIPITPGEVKKFLFGNPNFLNSYVTSSVDTSRLRDWLDNKESRIQVEVAYACSARRQRSCPNASLLRHFKRGQDADKYLEPVCCTCTQLPIGPKSLRPYIIYAMDSDNPQARSSSQFTVPRPMTDHEMSAFSRRYGFDIHRRMKMMR